MFFSKSSPAMPAPTQALPGRDTPIATAAEHYVLNRPLKPPYPVGFERVYFALGCFWGAERVFWKLGDGVWATAAGYQGGYTPNPTYDEVCTGKTGHTESVLVVYDPARLSFETLLKAFWESHDPTQGYRQGNDIGTQYRSAIYTTSDAQLKAAEASRLIYTAVLERAGYGKITTEIAPAPEFYFAEDYHQQYLAKVPGGYCGLGGTGVTCPMPHEAA
ncbi:MAG TPA: peptide-methionine (S)-S-oxide reductase MsrA [Hyphomicrobium sp.]|nr:peptide-methionine (S)-S-oxide reductase MsrA [Hyphomicrobium sp.]